MKKYLKKYLKTIAKAEEGYGTVEMLLIVAGLGLLATALFDNLTKFLVTEETSTANKVTNGVNDLIEGWFGAEP